MNRYFGVWNMQIADPPAFREPTILRDRHTHTADTHTHCMSTVFPKCSARLLT